MSMALAATLALLGAAVIGHGRPPTHDGAVRLQRNGTDVVEYLHRGVPFKPYVAQLRTPGGVNVLRDNVADHRHHHGLMFAVRAGGVNFWEEVAGCGTQRSVRLRATREGLRDTIEWLAEGAASPMLLEDRRIELKRSPDPDATLIEWRTTLTLPRGTKTPVTISGAHYHGLGMRFVQSMDGGTFENADGDPGVVFRGEERLMPGRWCAYRAAVDGREVTVAMFDHPSNPRPATWFTMPRAFGYLAATLRLHESPMEVLPGKPLALRYGVAVWDGKVERDRIERMYRSWVRR